MSLSAALVGEVGEDHECFIVSMPDGKKVVGGTRAEVSEFWFEHVKKPHVSWAQLVLRNGTVLDDNDSMNLLQEAEAAFYAADTELRSAFGSRDPALIAAARAQRTAAEKHYADCVDAAVGRRS